MFQRSILFLMMSILLVSLSGCKWNSDFRNRMKPPYQDFPPEPTLESESNTQEEPTQPSQPENQPDLKSIDDLSKIPELPDNPTPMR